MLTLCLHGYDVDAELEDNLDNHGNQKKSGRGNIVVSKVKYVSCPMREGRSAAMGACNRCIFEFRLLSSD